MLRKIPYWYLVLVAVLFGIGLSFLFASYGPFCQTSQRGNYQCAVYGFAVGIGTWVDLHSGFVVAIATAAIAWFTFSLRESTDRLWSATKSSVNALVSAESCYLFVTIEKETVSEQVKYGMYDGSESMFGDEIDSPMLTYSINNFGRTPALLKEMSNSILFARVFPNDAKYMIRADMPEDLVIAAGQPGPSLGCLMVDTLTLGDAVAFQKREGAFWFYGFIRFDDAFGRAHRLDYRFEYRKGGRRFRLTHYREWAQNPEKSDAEPPMPSP